MNFNNKLQELNDAFKISESRFRSIFENSPHSIQILSRDGFTLMVNAAYRKLWCATDEVVDKIILGGQYNILEDTNLEDAGFMPYIKRGFAGELVQVPAFYYEPLKLGVPGRARWTSGVIFPLKDDSGDFNEVAIIHHDVTEQYELIIERERLYEEAQESIKRRDEFISIISHELRTPISSLGLQIEVLSHLVTEIQTADAEHARKVMGYTKSQLERLTRLVDDMLDGSGISAGKLSIDPQNVDLKELIKSVLDRFIDQLKTMNINLEFQTTEALVKLNCDPFRIEQVITNLMTNAIRYGRLRPINVSLFTQQGMAIIKVKDHGLGIAEDDHERIFNRFERAHSSTDVAGLGLGLFINHQIIEQHGGRIYVQSKLGEGSTFIIELPL